MQYYSWGHATTLALGIFLAAVWWSRVLVVWLNRDSVADITSNAYAHPDSPKLPRVSIIVPARNEGEHVEAALLSLLQLDYPDYEVIAVNDRSDDNTGTLMDDLRDTWHTRREARKHLLRTVHVSQLPQGWLGKVHAMWTAAQQATGDWLLFTDADVVFRPDTLRRAITYAQRESADHVVLFPTMVMNSVGERMMMAVFQSQFVFAHRPWKVADPKSRDSIGVGAFNLVRRPTYEAIGTYAALRMSVLDDMKLGELIKRNGFRQRCVFGRDLLRLRWVVGTFGMVRILTKNFFAILRFNLPLALLAMAGVLFVNVVPFVGICLAHGSGRAGYLAALIAVFFMYIGMATKSAITPLYFFLHPLGTLLFVFAMARSALITLMQGGIQWRGTFYSLAELKRFSRESSNWSWL